MRFSLPSIKCSGGTAAPPGFRLRKSRARGNQIIVHSSDNETVLGSSRKLGGVAEHLIDCSEKRICSSRFGFASYWKAQ